MAPFEVRDAGTLGKGLFATQPLPAMYLVGRYEGRRSTEPSAGDHGYTMAMADGTLVDGTVGGNLTRYVNHAEPERCNAAMYAEGDTVRITLIRPVVAGEQILMFYGTDYDYFGHGIDTDAERRFLLDCFTTETVVVPPGFRPMFRLLWTLGESNVVTKVVLPEITDPILLDELFSSLAHSRTVEEVVMEADSAADLRKPFDILIADPNCSLRRVELVRPRASAVDRAQK